MPQFCLKKKNKYMPVSKKIKSRSFSVKKELNPEKKVASGLASFVERPVPEEEEVADFEKAIKREVRDMEIDSHLRDVYSDKRGRQVDVGKMKVKKKRHPFLSFLRSFIFIAIFVGAAYYVYDNYIDKSGDISSLKINLSGPEKVVAGEEFSYKIEYSNPTKFVLSDVYLEMQYPDNFIFTSASVSPKTGNYAFSLPDLNPGEKASLTIIGNLINVADSANLAVARLSYLPGSFSSRFKKESSISTIVSGPSFNVDIMSPSAVFIGQDNEVKINFSSPLENSHPESLSDFDIVFSLTDGSGAEIDTASSSVEKNDNDSASTTKISVKKQAPFVWQIGGLRPGMDRQEVVFNYKVKNKLDDFELKISLHKRFGEKDYTFFEKNIKPNLVSNDLNLTLFLNASKNDQALSFGDDLNYSINYSNKGNKSYQDVVIMAVLSGDILDWSEADFGKGVRTSNYITWTKKELPVLAEIRPGEEGEIDFRLKLKKFESDFLGKDLSISSYAQYSLSGDGSKTDGSKSNEIKNQINSDLSLREEIRYFDNDNISVGSGPITPKVGERTSYRVYFTAENNLHALRDVRVSLNLPPYVSFGGKEITDVGGLRYDENKRQVVWDLGLLPISKYRAEASFDISITPTEDDRDKVLILSPGSEFYAVDNETGGVIKGKGTPKTTRLEDDDIAVFDNSGKVQ